MTKLAARHTRTQAIIADTNSIILEGVGKIIISLGHGADKDANTLVGAEGFDIVADADDGGIETHGHLATVGREMIGDGVLDDLEQFLVRVGGADGQSMKQLDHETRETLKGAGDADAGVDLDENAFGCVDVDLEFSGFVDGGVEEGEEALFMSTSVGS